MVIQKDTGWQTAILSLYAWVLKVLALKTSSSTRSLLVLQVIIMYVVAQFYPLVKFYFSCLGIVMYDNEFETEKNKI